MPHLVLEHHTDTPDTVILGLLPKLTQCIASSHPSFQRSECKARAIRYPISCIGDGTGSNHMMHLTVSVLDGRPATVLTTLTHQLFTLLENEIQTWPTQPELSVRVTEINRAHYQKSSPRTQAS